MEFFRQAYWSGLPFPSPGIFPAQGSNPHFPALMRWFFTHWATLSIFFFFKILDIKFTPKAYLLSVCYMLGIVVSASFSSVAQLCPSLCDPMDCAHQPPCPSPTPGIYSDSCPLSCWCHPTISSYVVPFSSCLQSLPASGSFQLSQFFTSGGQSTGISASASVLQINSGLISFRMDWLDLIAVQVNLQSRLQYTVQKYLEKP